MDDTPPSAQSAFPPSTGLALASLVLGIAAVGLSFLMVGFLAGVAGLICGWLHLNKQTDRKAMARWGVGLSVAGILASVGFTCLYYYFFAQIKGNVSGGTVITVGITTNNPSPLPSAGSMLKTNLVWSANIPGANALCAGNWDGGAPTRVLVAAGQTLHVLDLAGKETSTMALPERFMAIECGRNKTAGALLLGLNFTSVSVIDHSGKAAWNEGGFMGIDGAHWGDLHGDGNDDMVVGMNGFGGLKVLSGEGKKLWSARMGNVWSQAIVPGATNRAGLVLATDAGGTIDVFDAAGHCLKSLHSGNGGYFTEMAAGAVGSNMVQIIAVSGNSAEAFDQAGKAAWSSPTVSNIGRHLPCAVLGDFAGDGSRQWALPDGSGDVVIVTTNGLKISSIPSPSQLDGLAVAPRQGQGALLLTLARGVVRAHSFGH